MNDLFTNFEPDDGDFEEEYAYFDTPKGKFDSLVERLMENGWITIRSKQAWEIYAIFDDGRRVVIAQSRNVIDLGYFVTGRKRTLPQVTDAGDVRLFSIMERGT